MSRLQEAREVFTRIREAWERGTPTALLTITEVQGSAYRQPGTKMMMAQDGEMFGMLSGGCLERDLFGWAEQAMAGNTPHLQRYNLSENELWSLGIGCKGNLEILIVPLQAGDPFWQSLMENAEKNQPVTSILEIPAGTRAWIDEAGQVTGDVADLPDEVYRQAMERADQRTRAEVLAVGDRRFCIDTMRPSEKLIVSGAGHDAIPVVRLAQSVGFEVTVLDPRSAYNEESRFPLAAHLVKEPADISQDEFPQAWWLIMNHHLQRDEAALKLALASQARFIGVLGPLARTRGMLGAMGHTLSDGPVFAPVGLDLAAETVDEVAVSIIAQLMAQRSKRSAAPLSGREKIHA